MTDYELRYRVVYEGTRTIKAESRHDAIEVLQDELDPYPATAVPGGDMVELTVGAPGILIGDTIKGKTAR